MEFTARELEHQETDTLLRYNLQLIVSVCVGWGRVQDEFLDRVVNVIAGYPEGERDRPGSAPTAPGNPSQAALHPSASNDSKLTMAASDEGALDSVRSESKASGPTSPRWDPEDPAFWEETDWDSGKNPEKDPELLEFVQRAFQEASPYDEDCYKVILSSYRVGAVILSSYLVGAFHGVFPCGGLLPSLGKELNCARSLF